MGVNIFIVKRFLIISPCQKSNMKKLALNLLVTCILILESSGLHISSTQKLRYTYETEAVLNEADILPEDKIYRMNSDVDVPGMKIGTIFELSSRWTNPSNNLDQIIEAEVSN